MLATAPWSGLTDRPAGLDDGDDDTTYTAGDGLTLNRYDIRGRSSTYIQRRVTGSCAVGSTIRSINEDGSVICETDATLNRSNPPKNNLITTLSGVSNTNYLHTITIGVDGLGLFAYFDSSAEDLMVAHCEDLECTSTTITRLDESGTVGSYSSVSIGSDGLGLISYISDSLGDLKVAHCSNLACTSANISTIDSTDWVGQQHPVQSVQMAWD